MINPSELAKRPVTERDLIPLATDEQATEFFQEQIGYLAAQSAITALHNVQSIPLLHISGEEEFSLIGRDYYPTSLKTRAERGRAQELLFRVMTGYGFDQTKSEFARIYNFRKKELEDDITIRPDGVTREVRAYPSQTIKRLEFQRVRDFVTDTGKTTSVWWKVVDKGNWAISNIGTISSRSPKRKN